MHCSAGTLKGLLQGKLKKEPKVVLFVVSDVRVDRVAEEETPQISGGEVRLLEPWEIKVEQLSPLAYTFTLPDGE